MQLNKGAELTSGSLLNDNRWQLTLFDLNFPIENGIMETIPKLGREKEFDEIMAFGGLWHAHS